MPIAQPPTSSDNPLFDAWRQHAGVVEERDALVRRYSFAIPTDDALTLIRTVAPNGVVEIGAGTGYWAGLLARRGVDVVAFDTEPAPSTSNPWFAGSPAWFPVRPAAHTVVRYHGARCLLLVWPTKNEAWPAETLELFVASGGTAVVHVGESAGGRTGDDMFHALLGELDRCWACAIGLADAACVCGVAPRFRRTRELELPRWEGYHDELRIYSVIDTAVSLGPAPMRRRRRRRLHRHRA